MNPAVASYVSDFLKPDMQHVYRQITALRAVTPWVLTHKRENAAAFPFPDKRLIVLPKPRLRWWRRLVSKHIRREPWQIFRWELRRAILELTRAEAKLLHIYFGHNAAHLRPLIKAWPHPVVVSFHGADAGVKLEKPRHLDALREVFQSASIVQARSRSLADDLVAHGCPPGKVRVQRTGVPLDEWPFVKRPVPADGAWRFLQSCRLIPKKGVDLTLQAFARIAGASPGSRLVIAGDGPLRDDLEKLAAQLGIAEKVRFTGFLDQARLRAEVYDAGIFLHPSRTTGDGDREGVPNAMLEAMASGATVIATNHGGIPEAVTDGVSGRLVRENDAEGLAAAMNEIITQPEQCATLAANGRRAVEDLFDRRENSSRLEACYLELIRAARK
jgi:colanic acid/amylovoran biosynthesis glycosyltransferase